MPIPLDARPFPKEDRSEPISQISRYRLSSTIGRLRLPRMLHRSAPVTAPSTKTHGIPPTLLILLSMSSVQIGAALAKGLFAALGPTGTVLLRVGFAAVVLLLVWRPRLHGHSWANYRVALLFGLTLAVMNLTFYEALSRVPLGIAVTVEFVGPLGVAVAGSRKMLDLLWVLFAAAGILALAPLGATGRDSIDPLGIVLALLAGACWAAYILLNVRLGRAFGGGTGLALAMAVAAIALLPVGIASAGPALLTPKLLVAGAGVALLSSVVPYSLEIEALRHVPPHIFGILMSLEPAIAALAGWLILHEQPGIRAFIAIGLVMAASVGASRSRATPVPE